MDQPHAFADPATSAHAARQPSLTDALRDWLRDLLQLAVLEGREAGAGLALMAGLGAAAAALLMTGWLALVFAFTLWVYFKSRHRARDRLRGESPLLRRELLPLRFDGAAPSREHLGCNIGRRPDRRRRAHRRRDLGE